MALKSTEEERAILRARSAVQRFPVVEWRQRTEDFHKRSINSSRHIAGPDAWRESDCDGGGPIVMAETDDWNPIHQAYPSQPDWDSRSRTSVLDSPQIQTPGTPGQWSHDQPSPNDAAAYTPPRLLHPSEGSGDDYFSRHSHAPSEASQGGYDNFLERANRTIARDQRHVPDPFLDVNNAAPSRPFGSHSRVSSVESIASIVDEKSNSPLNKAIASASPILLCFQDFISDNDTVHRCRRRRCGRFRSKTAKPEQQKFRARALYREVPRQKRGGILWQSPQGQIVQCSKCSVVST